MDGKFFIVDLIEHDPYPAVDANVRRSEIDRGRRPDQGCLLAGRHRNPYGNSFASVFGKCAVDLLMKERRYSMREFFRCVRQPGTDVTDSAQMLFAFGGEQVDRVGWDTLFLHQ